MFLFFIIILYSCVLLLFSLFEAICLHIYIVLLYVSVQGYLKKVLKLVIKGLVHF